MKLHIGGGKRIIPEFINVDGAKLPHIQYYDVTKLDFSDNSVDEIYSVHLLNYFTRSEAVLMLKEWRRVLKPDGILRVGVPDFDACLQIYLKGAPIEHLLGLIFGEMNLNGDKIWHKTAYNYMSLTTILRRLGFKDIEEYDWRETEFAGIDDHSHSHYPDSPEHIKQQNWDKSFTLMSLNIQCRK